MAALRVAFLAIILMSSLAAFAAPRNINFASLFTQDGLSHNGITAIVQDHDGYMWIGTQEGLNRYNGYEVRVFERELGNPDSLGDDWIWSLLVDKDGRLWVGTNNGGLSLYDPLTQSFKTYQHEEGNRNSLSSNQIRSVFQDSRGRIWVGTNGGGLNRYDPNNNAFVRYQSDENNPASLPDDSINVIYEWNGTLLVGSDTGLTLFNEANMSFDRHPAAKGMRVRALREHKGSLWIGTHTDGVLQLNPLTGNFVQHLNEEDRSGTLPGNLVRDLLVDHQGTLWLATDSGLAEWRENTRRFETYLPDSSDPYSIAGPRIDSLFEDRGEVLWIGTFSGLSRWNYASDAFLSFHEGSGHLTTDVVIAMAEGKDGSVWVGSYGGGVGRLVVGESGEYEAGTPPTVTLEDNRVMALATDENHCLWIGTRTAGLYKYNTETGESRHYTAENSSLSSNGITSLQSSNGVVWIGTYGGGLNRLDLSNDAFTSYRFDPEDETTLGSDRVLAIYSDSTGQYWIGTEDGGLNRFNSMTGTFTRYQNDPADPNSLSSNTAWEILESSDGTLWVGTLSGGLNRWRSDLRSQDVAKFDRINKYKGLPSDTIFGIIEDAEGNLWLSGNRGLVKYNPNDRSVRVFDKSNGLRGNEFNFGGRLALNSGLMMFGGFMGIAAFEPSGIRPNPHVPTVVVSASSNEIPYVHTSSREQSPTEIRLEYTDRFVDFRFAALDYASPEQNMYQYRLEGFEEDWIDAESFRRATYTKLPAGSYVFRVRASNNDGVWNEQGASLPLNVIPPPWATWWAYTIYSLIAASIVFGYVAIQRRRLAVAAQMRVQLEEQVKERTRELDERNSELEEANEALTKASMSDALTGLNNRRFLYEYLESQIASLNRLFSKVEGTPDGATVIQQEGTMFFMMIDLDGFKKINDTYGHAAGDSALIQVKDVLKSCTRDSDTIIRWGGDEFLIVGQSEGLDGVELLAERVRIGLSGHSYVVGEGQIGYLAGSIGIAMYPFNMSQPRRFTWEQVVALADQAAYVSKNNGGNSWVSFVGASEIDQADVLMMRDNIERVVEAGKVSIKTSISGTLKLDSTYHGNRDDKKVTPLRP